MTADQNKIPDRINSTITVLCSGTYFILLWTSSHVNHYGWVLLCGFLFAIIMISVYSLIHEAERGILHSNEALNAGIGRWLCTLFISTFTLFTKCCLRHDKKNRTDEEMSDLYYEQQG